MMSSPTSPPFDYVPVRPSQSSALMDTSSSQDDSEPSTQPLSQGAFADSSQEYMDVDSPMVGKERTIKGLLRI